MTIISQLIENIRKYGNCQIYYTCEDIPNQNHVFSFNFDGALFISELLYDYDRPFWNGKCFDKSIVVKHFDTCLSSSANLSLLEIMAHIVRLSITGEDYCAGITHNDKSRPLDDDMKVCELYNIVDSMLNLSNRQLALMCDAGGSVMETLLRNNVSKDLKMDCDLSTVSALIDEKLGRIKMRYKATCLLHDDVFSSKSAEEYRGKKEQWDKYCSDDSASNVSYIKR